MESFIESFILSARAVDLVLIVLLAEAAWLALRRRPREVLLALLPGGLILLALRAALGGGPWWAIALLLAASLPVHLADLAGRGWLRRRPPPER